MKERFGKDTVIALATVEHEVPYVRKVNAYYEDGSFYIITYALSDKIKQIENNPNVALTNCCLLFIPLYLLQLSRCLQMYCRNHRFPPQV